MPDMPINPFWGRPWAEGTIGAETHGMIVPPENFETLARLDRTVGPFNSFPRVHHDFIRPVRALVLYAPDGEFVMAALGHEACGEDRDLPQHFEGARLVVLIIARMARV